MSQTMMKRPLLVAAVAVVAAATALATRPQPDTVAATVYGHQISKSRLRRMVTDYTTSTNFKVGVGSSTRSYKFQVHLLYQQYLTSLIQSQVIRHLCHRMNVTVSDRQVARAEKQLLRSRGITTQAKLKAWLAGSHLTKKALRRSVRLQALSTALQKKVYALHTPTSAQLHAYYRDHPSAYTETHAYHIVLPLDRPAVAHSLASKLHAAPSSSVPTLFQKLARHYSLDPATASEGGDLGWVLKGSFSLTRPQLGRTLSDTKVATVTGPVKTTSGYEIVYVAARRVAPFRTAKGQVESDFLGGNMDLSLIYDRLLRRNYEKAHVTVDPSYGVFDLRNFTVTDPSNVPSSSRAEGS